MKIKVNVHLIYPYHVKSYVIVEKISWWILIPIIRIRIVTFLNRKIYSSCDWCQILRIWRKYSFIYTRHEHLHVYYILCFPLCWYLLVYQIILCCLAKLMLDPTCKLFSFLFLAIIRVIFSCIKNLN